MEENFLKPEHYPAAPQRALRKPNFQSGAFLLLILCLTSSPSLAQRVPQPRAINTKLDQQRIARLDQTIPRLMAEADIPGLSIVLINDAQVVWSRVFGVKNSETREPVDDNTVFEAASLSKPVFAYAVLQLVDSGKLDLDTPLTRYLPGRYDVGDDPRLDQITARRVLSHTTGFPNWRPRGGQHVDKTLKIYFTPGDRFSYSGEGFVYLARVVEHITGEKLDVFMKRTVLDPLGMTSSSYVWQDSYDARKTFTHDNLGRVSGRGKPEQANAAASLHTTASDYARFVCAIYRSLGAGDQIKASGPTSSAASLKPATARSMLTPQINVTDAGVNSLQSPEAKLLPAVSWGLGWGLEKSDDGVTFWHWGDNGDTKAYVMASEKQRTAVVMFANSSNGLSIINEVVEGALGGQHPSLAWINVERYNSPARLMFKAIVKSDAATVLAEYRKSRADAETTRSVPTDGSSNVSSASTSETKDPKSKSRRAEKNLSITETGSVASGSSKGSSVRLTEREMNRLGYQLLGLERVKDAIEVFKQNTMDFPEAFNTWDSLAEAFIVSGDKEQAIKYYKKSLELNPANTNAVRKLKELGEG